MNLEEINLYRIVHIENIPHLLQYGITHRSSQLANPNYVNIGDNSLIDNRSEKRVFIDNGGIRTPDLPSIILGDFIPFYFGVKMPMLYVIKMGGNFVSNATAPQDIIYVACNLSVLTSQTELFYFTDGHATNDFTSFYDSTRIADLPNIIDWPSVRAAYWGGQDNLDIKRKKQAEFLVKTDLLPTTIIGFGCYNESAETRLLQMGIPKEKIKIIPGAYF